MSGVDDQVMHFTDGSSMTVGDYVRRTSYRVEQLSALGEALRSAADNVRWVLAQLEGELGDGGVVAAMGDDYKMMSPPNVSWDTFNHLTGFMAAYPGWERSCKAGIQGLEGILRELSRRMDQAADTLWKAECQNLSYYGVRPSDPRTGTSSPRPRGYRGYRA